MTERTSTEIAWDILDDIDRMPEEQERILVDPMELRQVLREWLEMMYENNRLWRILREERQNLRHRV